MSKAVRIIYTGMAIIILLCAFPSLYISFREGFRSSEHSSLTVLEIIPTEPLESSELEEVEFISCYEYTEEELDLLARLVFSESSGESYETKLMVASVVMNRVVDSHFPDTIREVIYQKNQFAVTTHKINGVTMINRPADEESYRAAKEVLDYGSVLPSTVQVFYADYCTESWVTSRDVYKVSDNTVFAHIYGG